MARPRPAGGGRRVRHVADRGSPRFTRSVPTARRGRLGHDDAALRPARHQQRAAQPGAARARSGHGRPHDRRPPRARPRHRLRSRRAPPGEHPDRASGRTGRPLRRIDHGARLVARRRGCCQRAVRHRCQAARATRPAAAARPAARRRPRTPGARSRRPSRADRAVHRPHPRRRRCGHAGRLRVGHDPRARRLGAHERR